MTTQTNTTVRTTTRINGVDTHALGECVAAIDATPSLGACHFRASNQWVDGALNRAEVQGFFACGEEDASRTEPFIRDNDEPPLLLGENRAPNPVEYILIGLSGCLTTTLVYYAALMDVELTSVTSELEGDLDLRGLLGLDADTRPGYTDVRVTYTIESPAPRAKLEELVALAAQRSPVASTVVSPVQLQVDLA